MSKIKKLIEKDKPKEPKMKKNYRACFWCPTCKGPITIEYQKHCQCCGQKLKWDRISKMFQILERYE